MYNEELSKLISVSIADVNSLPIKPDKCAILQETDNQIRKIREQDENGRSSSSSSSSSSGSSTSATSRSEHGNNNNSTTPDAATDDVLFGQQGSGGGGELSTCRNRPCWARNCWARFCWKHSKASSLSSTWKARRNTSRTMSLTFFTTGHKISSANSSTISSTTETTPASRRPFTYGHW